jgi:aminopeptidase YwaD
MKTRLRGGWLKAAARLLAIAAFWAPAVAQAPTPKATPDVHLLRRHVEALASARFEGRRAGTPGAARAAQYIAEEFARLGLRPCCAVSASSKPSYREYLQVFNITSEGRLGQRNAMLLVTRENGAANISLDLRLNEDWAPLPWTSNARLENIQVVFAGSGIVADELKRDDYAGVDVWGKAVMLLSRPPEGDDPHAMLASYSDPQRRVISARERGARAVIFVASAEDLADDPLMRTASDHPAGDVGIVAVLISQTAARRILQECRIDPPLKSPPTQRDGVAPQDRTSSAEARDKADPAVHFNRAVLLREVALTIETEVLRRGAETANVIGIVDGTDPKLKSEAIVIGAHYDHLGFGGRGSLAPAQRAIHYGADDNASGTASLLELARLFARERPHRTLIFAAFGAEELGLLGSNYYVRNPVFPLAQTVAMLNMDMIGRLRNERLIVGGIGTSSRWRAMIDEINRRLGEAQRGGEHDQHNAARQRDDKGRSPGLFNSLVLNEDGFGPSDYASFYARRIPVLFFWTGTHEDYHKPSDTAEKINYEGEARIARFVYEIAREIDRLPQRPDYAVVSKETMARTTGFRVYLGTIPNYAETSRGVLIDAVREGSPAERAGLKAGDVIIRLAGREIKDIYDYTYALSEMKAGVEYELEVLRAGQRVRLKVTPEARR